jgi:hypothetical protein
VATATVTGNINDFLGQGFPDLHPRIVFTPSGPGMSGVRIFATKKIVEEVPHAEGYFSVDLQVTEDMHPVVYYQVSIEWLDPAGNYVSVDHLDWKLFVPAGGGIITDLFEKPLNPLMFWVGSSPPPYPQPGQHWLNTTTGDLKKWNS